MHGDATMGRARARLDLSGVPHTGNWAFGSFIATGRVRGTDDV